MKRRAEANTQSAPRNDWCTPEEVIAAATRVLGGIDFDPASNPRARVGARVSVYHADFAGPLPDPEHPNAVWGDGLALDWQDFRNAWINPPYSRGDNKAWATKIEAEARKGLELIALVPASPGAQWFNHYWRADAVCFYTGRLRFVGAPDVADFESAIVYYGPNVDRFRAEFGSMGRVVSWSTP